MNTRQGLRCFVWVDCLSYSFVRRHIGRVILWQKSREHKHKLQARIAVMDGVEPPHHA